MDITITYVVIVAVVTYIFGAITKAFVGSVPNKYIPLQNVIIGIISALVCYFTKVEPNLLVSFILCIISAAGAGGVADFIKMVKNKDEK